MDPIVVFLWLIIIGFSALLAFLYGPWTLGTPSLWQLLLAIIGGIAVLIGGIAVLIVLFLLLIGYIFKELIRRDVLLAFFYVCTVITAITPYDAVIGEIVFGALTFIRGLYVYAREKGMLPLPPAAVKG